MLADGSQRMRAGSVLSEVLFSPLAPPKGVSFHLSLLYCTPMSECRSQHPVSHTVKCVDVFLGCVSPQKQWYWLHYSQYCSGWFYQMRWVISLKHKSFQGEGDDYWFQEKPHKSLPLCWSITRLLSKCNIINIWAQWLMISWPLALR